MLTNNIPLLSIVIPTYNRAQYAISAIECILAIDSPSLELVIQDNSDNEELKHYVDSNFSDSRLVYQHTRERLSVVGNFNEGMEISSGEYVCFIGDDDGVNPEIIDAAKWAKQNNLDSLSVRLSAHYLWPDTGLSSSVFTKVVGGNLAIREFDSSITEIDLRSELEKLFNNGGLYYLDFNMPKVYHGIAKRSRFNQIKEITGGYFGGASPDMFSSVALACVCEKAAIIDYPLTIPGHCSVAEGTHHIDKAHLRPMKDAPHFKSQQSYQWSPLVPFLFIGEAFWVDAGVAALRAMGKDGLVSELNVPKLCAHCFFSYSDLKGAILSHMFKALKIQNKNRFVGFLQFVSGLFTGPFMKLIKRSWNRFLLIIKLRKRVEINDLNDMVACSNGLSTFLESNNQSFSSCSLKKS